MTSITPKLQGNHIERFGWVHYMAPPIIFLAPFIVFISFHGYPFFNPEVLWSMLGIILFGLACGAIIKKLGSLGQAFFIACLLELSLASVGDFQLKGKIICAIAAFLFAWVLRDKAAKVLALTFSVFIASTLAFPSENLLPSLKNNDAVSGNADLPPVVHLILDAHIGAEGIPQNIDMDRQFKNEFISFYADNGFRLYGNAYSRYQKTIDSIDSLINFETGSEAGNDRVKKHRRSDFKNEITRNKYFQEMTALGYKIKVYQTTAMNYCQENFRVASCYTYPLFSTRYLERLPTNTSVKVWALMSSFLFRSDFLRTVKNGYWHLANFIERRSGLALPFPWSWDGRRTTPIEASRALEKLRDDVKSSPQGTLFFAHLLMPHGPFVYDSNCQIYNNPVAQWSMVSDPVYFGKENSTASRAERYKMYLRQVNCLNKQLRGLFDAMRSAKIYDSATIIIHGDHGSRIRLRRPTYATRKEATPEDWRDSLSALFAVKGSGQKAGYDLRELSLNEIFAKAVEPILNREIIIAPQTPYVNLRVDDETFSRWPVSIFDG